MMNRRMMLRMSALALAGTAAPGCFGSFRATRFIWELNAGFESKFIQWIVFLAFVIFPVYEFAVLIDIVLVNLLEFWGILPSQGTATAEQEKQRTVQLDDHHTMHMVRSEDGASVSMEIRRHDRPLTQLVLTANEKGLRASTARGELLASTHECDDGTLHIEDVVHAESTVITVEAREALSRDVERHGIASALHSLEMREAIARR